MLNVMNQSYPYLSFFYIIFYGILSVSCQEEDAPTLNTSTPPTTTPTVPNNLTYQLVWEEEFEGDSLDEANWTPQIGDGCNINLCGWGNNELQYYTGRTENVRLEEGKLIIEARKERYEGEAYTSARILSKDKAEWRFGKIEVSAKLPKGQGIWPAIWMLPTQNIFGTWPKSGEIDIMELVGHEPHKIHGTVHFGKDWPENKWVTKSYQLRDADFSDDFHTFTLIWERNLIKWEVDGTEYHRITPSSLGNENYPFNEVFHLILNVAVGGNWPGNPDGSTEFPQTMEVDYIKVFQLQ